MKLRINWRLDGASYFYALCVKKYSELKCNVLQMHFCIINTSTESRSLHLSTLQVDTLRYHRPILEVSLPQLTKVVKESIKVLKIEGNASHFCTATVSSISIFSQMFIK